jgi:hypothetical protein
MERRSTPAVAAVLAALLLVPSACTKRVALGTSDVDLGDGREFEITFSGERSLTGRLVPGSTVRYVQGDSLFEAEVEAVSDEFIELSRRVLITDLNEWTSLRRVAEDSDSIVERPELGGALIARDEVQSITVITIDRRRIVTETLFWTAAALATGFAGFAR